MASSSSTTSSEAEALKNEGNEHFKQKRFNKAVYCYSQALEKEVNPVLLSNRAQAYLKLERWDLFILIFNSIILKITFDSIFILVMNALFPTQLKRCYVTLNLSKHCFVVLLRWKN